MISEFIRRRSSAWRSERIPIVTLSKSIRSAALGACAGGCLPMGRGVGTDIILLWASAGRNRVRAVSAQCAARAGMAGGVAGLHGIRGVHRTNEEGGGGAVARSASRL